jgi:hypothetical protein
VKVGAGAGAETNSFGSITLAIMQVIGTIKLINLRTKMENLEGTEAA